MNLTKEDPIHLIWHMTVSYYWSSKNQTWIVMISFLVNGSSVNKSFQFLGFKFSSLIACKKWKTCKWSFNKLVWRDSNEYSVIKCYLLYSWNWFLWNVLSIGKSLFLHFHIPHNRRHFRLSLQPLYECILWKLYAKLGIETHL